MGVMSSEVDFNLLLSDLGECCLQIEHCVTCSKEECIIGYAKECIKNCLKDDVTYIMDGCDNIPLNDSKIFDKESLITAISNILKQCKSCKEDHYDNCLINVMRSCYEVCLLGEIQKYKGSTFTYLNDIKNIKSEIADSIIHNYNSK